VYGHVIALLTYNVLQEFFLTQTGWWTNRRRLLSVSANTTEWDLTGKAPW